MLDHMTAFDDLASGQQQEMVDLITSLRESNMHGQEQLLWANQLLRQDDHVLHWFLDNANDSWQISPGLYYKYIRTWAPRIIYIDYFPFPLTGTLPELHDGTRFVVLASLWQAWTGNGDPTDVTETSILCRFGETHLPAQGERLLYRGEITYDAFTLVPGLPVTADVNRLYRYQNVGKFLGVTPVNPAGSSGHPINFLRAQRPDHFLNHWLPNLLSSSEYESACDMSIEVLQHLYAEIWNAGPHMMRERHQARALVTIRYDHRSQQPARVAAHA